MVVAEQVVQLEFQVLVVVMVTLVLEVLTAVAAVARPVTGAI